MPGVSVLKTASDSPSPSSRVHGHAAPACNNIQGVRRHGVGSSLSSLELTLARRLMGGRTLPLRRAYGLV